MLSHVEAAAVTEEVSFTAVPAKSQMLPRMLLKIQALFPVPENQRCQNIKQKITEIACATSSSSASITGAVAAIADPPQIEDPTPTSVEIFPECSSCDAKYKKLPMML